MDGENNQPVAPVAAPAQSTQSFGIPLAIVFGFGLIAAAIFFSGGSGPVVGLGGDTAGQPEPQEASVSGIRPVDENDHIRGNPNASIMIVEYSDFDCPFCKQFHDTMNQILDNYGAAGQVAWVYRQFPIESLHPNAPYISEASECVAKVAGNDAFWTFSDLVFGERQINQPTNTARLSEFAEIAGADVSAFESCLESGETAALVQEDYDDAINSGARGTPHSVVVVAGQQVPIQGAQSYADMKQNIDNILAQISGQEVKVPAE